MTTSAEIRLSIGEPVFAHQPAQAAAERQTGDSCVGDGASRGGKSEHLCLAVKLAPEHPTLGPHRSFPRIHMDAFHRRQVDDEPTVVGPVTWRTVAAAAHRDSETVHGRRIHRTLNVGNAGAARNQRWPSIDIPVPHPSGGVVAGVTTLESTRRERIAGDSQRVWRPSEGHLRRGPQEQASSCQSLLIRVAG